MNTILIIDDDSHIVNLVEATLRDAGYHTHKAMNGIEALSLLERYAIDLAIVDVMMPKMDGYTVTRKIKNNYDIPVILLTARGQLHDKENGYIAGTDDYIVKPFELRELIFRIQAVLRRYDKPTTYTINLGDVKIDKRNYEVQIGKQHLIMPLKEFELLALLASRPNQVFNRDNLIENIWGIDFQGDERTVNVHIKRIRERLRDVTSTIEIVTVRGVGYKLEVTS
ncbi:response regulator transcription factor [Alkalihalobacillus hwajinpoensis]|uniref:response regulator transcription factor n=1 Tax=Guptibacillus hwajinpoensis TaxID=208199 RepID=UPI0018831CB8|nr:response regulator transcription factor [Pseudalkalibacillus hwajinpoensis]MBF0705817.1 response regulator transcription factor [Pseudalkalibacillus hwajinpoensis]